MEFTANTEREIYMSLNNEVQKLRETIERFGTALLHLENTKLNSHELRIEALERSEQERKGMWKMVIGIGIFLSIAISILTIKTFMK